MDSVTNTSYMDSMLPKLMAMEDIKVVHGNFSTASFNPMTRVLELPAFCADSKDQYDLMVAHEVGHALFTPTNAIAESKALKIPHCVVNVIEDIRIERLIKLKYPGARKAFVEGYKQFSEKNFFGVKGKDLTTLRPIDRINIFAKGGEASGVVLTPKEQNVYDLAYKAETFGDIFEACRRLIELEAQPDEPPPQSGKSDESAEGQPGEPGEESEGSGQPGETDDQDAGEDESSPAGSSGKESKKDTEGAGKDGKGTSKESKNSSGSKASWKPEEIESLTQKTLEDSLKTAAERAATKGNVWADAPSESQVGKVIHPVSIILKAIKGSSALEEKYITPAVAECQSVANSMVMEFQQRKAALDSRREEESTRGVINVGALHRYKFDDDIFKSITEIKDGTNHGFYVLVDYSRSMNNFIAGVRKKMVILAMFFRKINVPFMVYAFTDAYSTYGYRADKPAGVDVTGGLGLLEMINSRMPLDDFNIMARALLHNTPNYLHKHFTTHGTPLIDAIYASAPLIEDLKTKYRIDKMNFVLISDGDGGLPRIVANGGRAVDMQSGSTIHSKIAGHKFSCPFEHDAIFTNLIRGLKIGLKLHSTVCYFLTGGDLSYAGKNIIDRGLQQNAEFKTTGFSKVVGSGPNEILVARGVRAFDAYYIVNTSEVISGYSYSLGFSGTETRGMTQNEILDLYSTTAKIQQRTKLLGRNFVSIVA